MYSNCGSALPLVKDHLRLLHKDCRAYCGRYDDHVHDPIEWKAEDRAVAGDTEEETRCSASHDRGHRTVLDSEHFSYL